MAYANIGAYRVDEDHPADEIDVNVTGALWLVAYQPPDPVTADQDGLVGSVLMRPGTEVGFSEFVLVTGSVNDAGAGNEFTVRAVSGPGTLSSDGSGAASNLNGAAPEIEVSAGDFLGIYGLEAPPGGIETVIRANTAQGNQRTVPSPIPLPVEGEVITLNAFETAGVLLIGDHGNPPPPPPEPVDFDCACPEDFRFEAADLRTGIVKAILEPLSADWQTTLNQVGQGSMTLATKGIRARDIWPHLTSVYCLRTSGGDATPENPYCEGGFLIDKFTASDTGQTNVGFRAIEDYIWHRILRSDLDYEGAPTRLAAVLVNTTTGNGIPLTGDYDASTETTDREYFAYDRKNVGEAINELVEAEPGIEWEMVHTKSPGGAWSSTMVFRDTVGAVRALVLQSDVEGAGYGLDVDAADHATLVDAIGEGNEDAQLIATAIDTGTYPQFDAAPAFKDINILPTLQQQANGYLADHQEPVAVPSMTIMGTQDPDPALLRNGDTVERVRTNFGALSYDGPARIVSTSWSLKLGGVSRTYQFLSTGRASQTVLNQTVSDDCPDCGED